MSLGRNLQFLRRMRNRMTQEELAEKLSVSRQTVSKWELDAVYPEMEKVVELCNLFNCSMDQLIREDMTMVDEVYSNIRLEWVAPLRYLRHIVISTEPEADAQEHMRRTARALGIAEPQIIGWDFPQLSQEQINVYNMHGYAAALLLPENAAAPDGAEVFSQSRQQYAAITIREPFSAPFALIPKAYQVLLTYMKANNIRGKKQKDVIDCFEKEYTVDGVTYMDVYIVVE